MFSCNRTFFPDVGFALSIIIDEAQALAFKVLEVEGEAAISFDHLVGGHAAGFEMI